MSVDQVQTSRTRLMQLITEELTRSIKSEDDVGGMKLIGLNIQSIPPEAVELIRESVERLSLQNNNISNLPQYFNRLSKLRYLDIHDNQFSTFPDILTTMSELEILDISFNNLRSLPNDLGHLKNLKVLSLKNNNFEILPTSILSIKNLKILEIENNPLKLPANSFISNIPHKIHSQEWLQEIKNYLVSNKELIESNLSEAEQLDNAHNGVATTPIKETEKPPLISSQSHIPQQSSSSSVSAGSSHSVQYLERSRSTSESYVSSRAAKRMGFIVKRPNPETSTQETVKEALEQPPHFEPPARRNRSMSTASTVSNSPIPQVIEEEQEQETIGKDTRAQIPNGGFSPMNSEKLDSIPEHRSNDYFKRLSTLPEQRLNLTQFKIVDISRKILFSITEFQSTITKLNAFCSEKSIIIEMVSQLYHSKTVIDHLVESLETTEENNDGVVAVDEILKSVSQTVSIFKKMIDILQSNYDAYVKNADICFIRMLLLSLFLSYGEVYNAYKILNPESTTSLQRQAKDIYSNSHTINVRNGPSSSQLPPLKVNDLSMNPTVTQQQLNEFGEADQKLYESLNNALESSDQVYAELNEAISKSAIANAIKPAEEQQQNLNGNTISKIKELTNTCVVSMDLNRKIKNKLHSNTVKSINLIEKKKFFDEINALLKSIITILGSTKSIMNEMPILNEVRPSLANLTKATKDVTIMLEVSSYRMINDSFSSLNSAVPQSATSIQAPMLKSIPSVMSIPQMNTPFLPNMPTSVHTPLQSAAVTHPNANPFEATLANNLQNDENNIDTIKY